MIEIIDFPKLQCPFVREQVGKRYIVKNEFMPGYEWLYDKGVVAVDKLHGTNICVNIAGNHIESIDNRDTRIVESCWLPTAGNGCKMLIGVLEAVNRGWLKEDGKIYGELIGPDINENIHKSPGYLFVPFSYLRSKCHWHSWVQNKYSKNFVAISEWFKELPSMFSKRLFNQDTLAEGLVFYHPDGRRCKIRRDMFDWYDGKEHKEAA